MNYNLLYDLLFALAGLYVFSLYIKVSMSRDLDDIRILLPRKLDLNKCHDSDAFLKRIKPVILLFGASVLLTGVVGALEDVDIVENHGLYVGALVLCIVMAVFLVIKMNRTVKQFWDIKEDPPGRNRRR